MRYLDPKNDLIFKRVFGEHPHILKSFLNALLPLEEDKEIVSVEYLPIELVPEIPVIIKNSLVDVRCVDQAGRQFIVEMQMLWTDSFKSIVSFNDSKAYTKQLKIGTEYKELQTVYSLSIVNDLFEPNIEGYYHHYKFVHNADNDKLLDGLQLIFVELPKFKANNYSTKNLNIMWLCYLNEIEDGQEVINKDLFTDLQSVPEIAEALELTKESSYTAAQLEAYDKYWDRIAIERTYIADARAKGIAKGLAKGLAEGKAEGKELLVCNLKSKKNMSAEDIAELVELTSEKVIEILQKHNLG